PGRVVVDEEVLPRPPWPAAGQSEQLLADVRGRVTALPTLVHLAVVRELDAHPAADPVKRVGQVEEAIDLVVLVGTPRPDAAGVVNLEERRAGAVNGQVEVPDDGEADLHHLVVAAAAQDGRRGRSQPGPGPAFPRGEVREFEGRNFGAVVAGAAGTSGS